MCDGQFSDACDTPAHVLPAIHVGLSNGVLVLTPVYSRHAVLVGALLHQNPNEAAMR